MDFTLTPHRRVGPDPTDPALVWVVRVGTDVAGFVHHDNGHCFGYVLVDPTTDDGTGAKGHRSLDYCLRSVHVEDMGRRVADAWSNTCGAAFDPAPGPSTPEELIP